MFQVDAGLATLTDQSLRILSLLEQRFLDWARHCGAHEVMYPPLLRVTDLQKLDYFSNFPHLAVIASELAPPAQLHCHLLVQGDRIPSQFLAGGAFALPSAACYSVYLGARNTRMQAPLYVTTVAQCFRNELEYDGLRRLWGFQMREIVCIGDSKAVQAHIRSFRGKILEFAESIGLPLSVEVANDPFFNNDSDRAVLQRLLPVKEELVHAPTGAIASLNFHRNFFGERCSISQESGEPAFTSCVAFGLERWLHALDHQFSGEVDEICNVLSRHTRVN